MADLGIKSLSRLLYIDTSVPFGIKFLLQHCLFNIKKSIKIQFLDLIFFPLSPTFLKLTKCKGCDLKASSRSKFFSLGPNLTWALPKTACWGEVCSDFEEPIFFVKCQGHSKPLRKILFLTIFFLLMASHALNILLDG